MTEQQAEQIITELKVIKTYLSKLYEISWAEVK